MMDKRREKERPKSRNRTGGKSLMTSYGISVAYLQIFVNVLSIN
jgi:hypothetical protein